MPQKKTGYLQSYASTQCALLRHIRKRIKILYDFLRPYYSLATELSFYYLRTTWASTSIYAIKKDFQSSTSSIILLRFEFNDDTYKHASIACLWHKHALKYGIIVILILLNVNLVREMADFVVFCIMLLQVQRKMMEQRKQNMSQNSMEQNSLW